MIKTNIFFERFQSQSQTNTSIDFTDCIDVTIINANAFSVRVDNLEIFANTTVTISCNEGEILTGKKNVVFGTNVGFIQVIKRKPEIK